MGIAFNFFVFLLLSFVFGSITPDGAQFEVGDDEPLQENPNTQSLLRISPYLGNLKSQDFILASDPALTTGTGEEPENGTDTTGDDDEEEYSSYTEHTTTLVVISFMIIICLIFEFVQRRIDNFVDSDLHPIVDSFWQQLTIFGLLSLITFMCVESGRLDHLSERIFGDDESNKLGDLLETLHEMLFITMICYILEVLCLVWISNSEEKKWRRFENAVNTPAGARQAEADFYKAKEEYERSHWYNWCVRSNYGNALELFEYYQLRYCFINPTHIDYPRLEPDFDFAGYLIVLLGRYMGRMVNFSFVTWIIMEVAFVTMWGISFLDMKIQLLFYMLSGISIYVTIHQVIHKLNYIKSQVLPASHQSSLSTSSSSRDDEEAGRELLPHRFEPPPYLAAPIHRRESGLERFFYGHPANQMEALFWFDRHGENLIFDISRTIFLWTAIYFALLIDHFHHFIGEYRFIIRLLIYISIKLPIAAGCFKVPRLVSVFVVLSNIELKRKQDVVAHVQRVQKAKKSIRVFRILQLLQTIIRRAEKQLAKKEGRKYTIPETISEEKKEKLRAVFNIFDQDGTGSISTKEFRHLLRLSGRPTTKKEAQLLLAEIDIDNSGDLSFDEYLAFMGHHLGQEVSVEAENIETLVNHVFELYDTDKSGGLTAQEFRDMLTSIHHTISLEEAQQVIKDLDTNDSGEIEPFEFAALLKKQL